MSEQFKKQGMHTYYDQEKDREKYDRKMKYRKAIIKALKRRGFVLDNPFSMKISDLENMLSGFGQMARRQLRDLKTLYLEV